MNKPIVFLLVEDDDTHAHLVSRSLANSPVANEVFRVKDGAEAIQFLNREGQFKDQSLPDMILLDLNLPKINGHELLSIIKTKEGWKQIPIVVMTTSNAQSDRTKAYQRHANSYVVKPVDFNKFRELIHDLCRYWGVWNQTPELK